MRHLVVLLLQLQVLLVAATTTTARGIPAMSKREGDNRIRGTIARRKLSTSHANIFSFERRDPLISQIKQPFEGGARTPGLGLTFEAPRMTIMAKRSSIKGKGSKGSKKSIPSENPSYNNPLKDSPSGDMLNLPTKTSGLKYKLGKNKSGGGQSKTSSTTVKSSGTAYNEIKNKSLSKKSKSNDSSKMTKGPKVTLPPSESVTGGMDDSPSPTPYHTPSPTHKPYSAKYSYSSSKSTKSMMGGGMKTKPPAQMPTPAPVSCSVNAAGNTGSMDGDAFMYDFFYQLELAEELSAAEVDDTLLVEIEQAMANALIPDLFPMQCGTFHRVGGRGGRRKLQDSPRYIGLTTRPPDFVLRGCKF